MTDIALDQWVHRFSVKNESHLSNPKAFDYRLWVLPKNAVFHYVPDSPQDMGPDKDDFPLRDGGTRPYVYHQLTWSSQSGTPRLLKDVNVDTLVRHYYQKNKQVKRVTSLKHLHTALLDKRYPVIINYALAALRYRYDQSAQTPRYRFNNMWDTVCEQTQSLSENSTRAHILFFPLPTKLPLKAQFHSIEDHALTGYSQDSGINPLLSRQEKGPLQHQLPVVCHSMIQTVGEDAVTALSAALGMFEPEEVGWSSGILVSDRQVALEAWSAAALTWFSEDDMLRLADLWKWLSEERASSSLDKIRPEYYDKVFFLFTVGGKFSVLSMAELDTWRRRSGSVRVQGEFYQYLTNLLAFRQLDAKDMIIETVPDTISSQAAVIGVVPSGSSKVPVPNKHETIVNASLPDEEEIPEIDEQDALPEDRAVRLVDPDEDDSVIVTDTKNPLEAGIARKSSDLLKKGTISLAEHRRHIGLSQRYKTIEVNGETLEALATPDLNMLWNFTPATIPDIPNVTDKGMLTSSLINYDRTYIEKVMDKDTASMVLAIQKAGIAVTQFEREEYSDALSKTVDYRVKVQPVYGKESTLSFQLPKIDKNGKYRINGVRYYMRKLRADMPIRKINTNEVALTSYYGKLFVERSQKKVASYDNWITSAIVSDILSDNSTISAAVYGNSYGENQPVPRIYSAIAQMYLSFTLAGIQFYFDYGNLSKNFVGIPVTSSRLPVGKQQGKTVFMNEEGKLFDEDGTEIGTLPSLMGLDESQAPNERVMLRCLGQEIPLGIVLSCLMGLNRLATQLLDPPYPRRRVKGAKNDTEDHEFEVVFADEVWVFPRARSKASLIFSSLNAWRDALRTYQVAELNDATYYASLFVSKGLSQRHFAELGLIEDMFLDPIAIEVLTKMNEPTTMVELFIRAAELLVTDAHKSDLDTSLTLVKGYERMNGAVYRSLVDAIRQYRNRPVSVKTSVELNPFEVLSSIQKDPSVSLVEDSNVIHNLKEKENMTYSGTGGRSKRAMTRRTRAFHQSDLGVRSEAGVDSGDVGINMFMPPNPNITSLRGTVSSVNPLAVSPTQLVSTSMLVSPFAEYDDGKRVNFINIQQDHVVAIKEGQIMPVRTGYDQVLPHRADEGFSKAADDDGVVTQISQNTMSVEYQDGRKETFEIGRWFGRVTGHVVPHEVVTDFTVGQSFKKGTILAWNSGFIKRDVRDPTQCALTSGTLAYTVLWEKNETWEDSSLISPELAERMKSKSTHVRTLFCKFTDAIHHLVSVGDDVDIDTILATLEDRITANVGSGSFDALNMLARPAPRSHHAGRVEKIDVVYFGDKDDMSPTLRKVADKYDKERARLAKALGRGDALTGEITSPTRVEGISVDMDMMAISIYITEERIMSGGDKLVLSNQLKSVTAGEQKGPTYTATELWPGGGTRKVELEFSYRAEEARIVHSSIMAGLSVICQEYIGWAAVAAWDD